MNASTTRGRLCRGLLPRLTTAAALVVGSGALLSVASAQQSPTLRPDSRLIYVSSSTGNDANDGLSPSTPKRSLAGAVSVLRDGFPDWIFLRRGDSWAEGFGPFEFSGRSANEPVVISCYGTGSDLPRVFPEDPSTARPDEPNTMSYGVEYPAVENSGGDVPVLIPGDGWEGPTPQPAAVGNPEAPGFQAKAIARWDVVPFQVFREEFSLGVVAFHQSGIDRVEFSVNGGHWESTEHPVLNDRTGVTEYTVALDPELFIDGDKAEIRAIVYPNNGVPRVLAGEYDIGRSYAGSEWTGEFSMVLYPGSGQAYPEQVIELEAGTYTWGVAPIYNGVQEDLDRWLIYRPAPGVSRDEVIIEGLVARAPYPRLYEKIKFESVTIKGKNPFIYFSADTDMLWFEGVEWVGNGQHNEDAGTFVKVAHQWWTNSSVRDARYGYSHQFVRNTSYANIGEDVIREGNFIVNVTVDNVDSGPTDWHTGVFTNPLLHDNRIYFGNSVSNVGIATVYTHRDGTYGHWENTDVAIVDCFTEKLLGVGNNDLIARFGAPTQNLLIRDSEFIGDFIWRTGSGVPAQWVFQPEMVHLEGNRWFNGVEYTPDAIAGVTIVP